MYFMLSKLSCGVTPYKCTALATRYSIVARRSEFCAGLHRKSSCD